MSHNNENIITDIFNLSKFNFSRLNKLALDYTLTVINFFVLLPYDDIDSMLDKLYVLLNNIFTKVLQIKRRNVSDLWGYPSWFDKSIIPTVKYKYYL